MPTQAPPPEVIAAIIAAVDAVWPRPVAADQRRKADAVPTWRFSGRTWGAPVAADRSRPAF